MPLMFSMLRECIEDAERAQVKPLVVETAEQAAELTKRDPFGTVWEVGDEYYWIETSPVKKPVVDDVAALFGGDDDAGSVEQ